jgi:hypothetical protein
MTQLHAAGLQRPLTVVKGAVNDCPAVLRRPRRCGQQFASTTRDFENASATEELVAVIVFNSDAAEPKDDIGIGQSLTAIPTDVLSAVLNVPVSVFEQIPTVSGRIVIVKRPDDQTGARA